MPNYLCKYTIEEDTSGESTETQSEPAAVAESSQNNNINTDPIPDTFNSLAAFISDATLANFTAAAATTKPAPPLAGTECPRRLFIPFSPFIYRQFTMTVVAHFT